MNQNHQTPPYFNPKPFTFLPPNPQNPNFSYSFPPNPNNTNNLLTTLSTLKNLINLAETTVNSLTNLLPFPNLRHQDLISCPFDVRHRMPPESLFKHSLICPSSPAIINLDILNSLQYPKSLKSQVKNRFIQSIGEDDLCFSIDDYGDFGANFFYKDCPSVYCSSEIDSSKRTFTLPSVLSIHCANFVCSSSSSSSDVRDSKEDLNECLRILPSDLLAVRSEVEGWSDYPHLYSLLVLRVVLGLGRVKESEMLKWVILNSHRYGVIIDGPMRDHVFLLMKLCLKAVSMEAYRSNELLLNDDVKERNGGLRFNCLVLVEVMTWLASQLSVLYGEPNGRFFCINMLKHCVLNAALSLSSFSLEKETTETSVLKEGSGKLDGETNSEVPRDEVIENVKIEEQTEECERGNSISPGNIIHGSVFVSQVAAAIAALHERSVLEEKIKGLWVAGSLSKSQRLAEHSYVTTRADEERSKRSNYRPILEHDGLLWHRSRNQDLDKNKTREELLAEERDYKRRRMSYRGKKGKRSRTEVMRDIIEEHMEEIYQAGGIGCFVKGSAESGVFAPGSVAINDMKANNALKRNVCDSPEPSGGESHGYGKQIQERLRPASHERGEHFESQQKSSRKEKRDRGYRSRSPEKYRSRERSHEKHRHLREYDEMESARHKYDKYDSVSPRKAKYHESRSFSSVSNPSTDLSDKKYDRMSESKDKYRGRIYGSCRSESVAQTIFEERYDPSQSDSRYEAVYDEESSGSKYGKQDKLYSSNNDKYSDEMQRTGNTGKGRYDNQYKKP